MVSKNRLLFEKHFNKIPVARASLFDTSPPQLSGEFTFDRIEGMLLGLAIGDALGITTEGWLPGRRRSQYGEIRDYIPNRYDPRPIGFPSDDSQLAFWTLEQMIEDNGFIPDNVADRFTRGRIFGIGSAVKEFIRRRRDEGCEWYECGARSAGNGALMRIAPIVIPHLASGGAELFIDTALLAMTTHNDTSSIASCVAFVNILWHLLSMTEPPEPEFWVDMFCNTAGQLETDARYNPRGGKHTEYCGSLSEYVRTYVPDAYEKGLPVLEAVDIWYSGAYLLETVPSVIFILMKHGHDPEEAIVRAVNDTKDNDTIGAIVGAAMGALHGKKGLPKRWIDNLSGRTTDRDDGKMFELIEESQKTFWRSD